MNLDDFLASVRLYEQMLRSVESALRSCDLKKASGLLRVAERKLALVQKEAVEVSKKSLDTYSLRRNGLDVLKKQLIAAQEQKPEQDFTKAMPFAVLAGGRRERLYACTGKRRDSGPCGNEVSLSEAFVRHAHELGESFSRSQVEERIICRGCAEAIRRALQRQSRDGRLPKAAEMLKKINQSKAVRA